MSYILDALQRAEAERARGGVPTLQTRTLSDSATTPALVTPQRLRLAMIGLALMLIAAGLTWWLWGSTPPPAAVASKKTDVPPVSVAPAPTVPVAPAVPAAPAPAVSVAPAAPAAPTSPTAAAMPMQPAPVAVSAVPSAAPPVAPPAQPTALPQAAATSPPKPQPAPQPAAPAAAPALAPLLSELPEDIRRRIPPMAISGAVYSADPAQRLLLVNGQVLNEGSQVAPDLSLVEIRSSSAEFNFQGTRFRIAR